MEANSLEQLERRIAELESILAATQVKPKSSSANPYLLVLTGGLLTLSGALLAAWLPASGLADQRVVSADLPDKGVFTPSVNIYDKQSNKVLVDMLSTDTGAGGFQVWDREGRRRILLGTNDHGQAGLTFWDEEGRITDRFWQTKSSNE